MISINGYTFPNFWNFYCLVSTNSVSGECGAVTRVPARADCRRPRRARGLFVIHVTVAKCTRPLYCTHLNETQAALFIDVIFVASELCQVVTNSSLTDSKCIGSIPTFTYTCNPLIVIFRRYPQEGSGRKKETDSRLTPYCIASAHCCVIKETAREARSVCSSTITKMLLVLGGYCPPRPVDPPRPSFRTNKAYWNRPQICFNLCGLSRDNLLNNFVGHVRSTRLKSALFY